MKDGIKQHINLRKENEDKRNRIIENRAMEMRRKAGIFWCTLIIILSFFPMIYIGDKKKNMIRVLLLAIEKTDLIIGVVGAVLILIPLLYAGRLVYYIVKREGFLFCAVAPFVNFLGSGFIFILMLIVAVHVPESNPFGYFVWPTTIWFAIRPVLGLVEFMNRTSGQDIFLAYINHKNRNKNRKR